MLCKNCKIINICSVYEFKKKHELDIDINISNCKHKPNNEEFMTLPKPKFMEMHDYTSGPRPDAKEAERKILNIEPVKEDKTIMTCATCGGTDYADYISICSKCGTETCGNCATTDNGLNYCSKCWEEI